jgi:putative mRNA 3-end processing factor
VVKIKFYGGTEEVGNVRITIENAGKTLCLDYGTRHDGKDDDAAFPKVDYVAVSHGHLDHIGNLAYATKLNKCTKFIGTTVTRKLSEYQLNDILKIEERRRRGNEPVQPNPRDFALEDILDVVKNWIPTEYNKPVTLDGFEVKLANAGHIPGSSIIEVKSDKTRIVYTGDINLEGNLNGDFPDLNAIEKNPTALIIESTYGGEERDTISKEEGKFIEYAEDALRKGKNLFVPAFAIERIQRVGYLLNRIRDAFPEYEFYIVSPSYMKVKDIAYGNLDLSKLTESARPPKDYRYRQSVMVSTSGFCTGGWSKKILEDVIDNENYTVILPSGFLPEGSPVKDAAEKGYIEIAYKNIRYKKKVRADIKRVKLSAHSDMKGLRKIVETIAPAKTTEIYLVHGEPVSQQCLKTHLESLGYKVKIPKKYEEVEYR